MNKSNLVKTMVGVILFLASIIRGLASAATSIDTQSSAFATAVRYGLSYTILTSSDLNYWADAENNDASKITQKVHDKLGGRVRVNVFGKKLDGGDIRISVEFPAFEVSRFKFILNFVQTGEGYTFLGYENDFLSYQFDFKTVDIDLELPREWRAVVTKEFALTQSDIKQIQSWFEGFLTDECPKFKGRLNHIIVAPFSKTYNATFRVYWVEGKQVIEFDRLWMKGHPGVVNWSVRMNYNEPSIAHPETGAEGGVLRSTSFELATCVRDGSLISIGP